MIIVRVNIYFMMNLKLYWHVNVILVRIVWVCGENRGSVYSIILSIEGLIHALSCRILSKFVQPCCSN